MFRGVIFMAMLGLMLVVSGCASTQTSSKNDKGSDSGSLQTSSENDKGYDPDSFGTVYRYKKTGVINAVYENNHLFLTKAKCRDMVENNVFRQRQAGQSSAMQGIQKTIDECMDEAGYERVK